MASPVRGATPTSGRGAPAAGLPSRRMFRGEVRRASGEGRGNTPNAIEGTPSPGLLRNPTSPRERGEVKGKPHASNMITLRTVLPAFIAAKPSLISDSFSLA